MHRPDYSLDLILLYVLLIPVIIGTALSQGGSNDDAVLNQVVLNVYVDDRGRALINGYADDPGSLLFLNSSEYTYEDDSRQLYAITSALTSKSRDNWTTSLQSVGSYDQYNILFYLPGNTKLKRVDCSLGLDYLVYAANESVIAEVQGYNVTDPAVNIEYLLPLPEASRVKADIVTGTGVGYLYTIIALVIFLAASFCLLVFLIRSKHVSVNPTGRLKPHEETSALIAPNQDYSDLSASMRHIESDHESSSRISEISRDSGLHEKREAGIELTSEISAVMDTLTDKEQAVLKALLQRGGTMTQTEIRYETDLSKSSLSGILTSMEKRKIITKRESGRTNVIELSERFLNLKEQS
jgi:DNA-binding MarR family transcriptional regulator